MKHELRIKKGSRVVRKKILYPKLSYKIIGILFDAYNNLGGGCQERYYQRAIASLLKEVGILFEEQKSVIVKFKDKDITKSFLDFVIENKIILEIKKGNRFLKSNIDQLYSYLRVTGLKLGILANFTKRDLQFKRIVNINQ